MKQTRNTHQKKLIMDIMKDNYTHPTADEVYERAKTSEPHISRGTVYRILNTLADSGEIKRLPMPIGPDHYDSTVANHYHFICRNCHKVADTELKYNEDFNLQSTGMEGYKTEWHRLILVGLCPKCNEKV